MSSVLRDLGAIAFGLLFVVIGAVLFGPTPWSAARLLRKGRRVTATVVDARASGISRGSAGPGGYNIDRPYPATVRLAFRLDGRHMERTLRLAEPAAQAAYQAGQEMEIYVGGRLRTRIRSQSEANEHGDFERALGICLALAGLFWIVYWIIVVVTGRVF